MEISDKIIEVEIHLLDLRYCHTRIKNEKVLSRMQNSIRSYGQIEPGLGVPCDGHFILIDGYLRLQGLKACGHDCIKLLITQKNESDSLFSLLARNNDRHWESIEQASLLNELRVRFNYSFSDIAKRLGRDKSWVKRHIDLIVSLPDEICQAVMMGKISTWSASHVLVPLSRVNEKDACELTNKISTDPVSTRELICLYKHYQKSNRTIRDRIIAEPSLFIKTILQQEQNRTAQKIEDGPEGQWDKDVSTVSHILKRLLKTAESVFYPSMNKFEYERRVIWLKDIETMIVKLMKEAERKSNDNTSM